MNYNQISIEGERLSSFTHAGQEINNINTTDYTEPNVLGAISTIVNRFYMDNNYPAIWTENGYISVTSENKHLYPNTPKTFYEMYQQWLVENNISLDAGN